MFYLTVKEGHTIIMYLNLVVFKLELLILTYCWMNV